MKFLILHGSFGSPEDNWFEQLKQSLNDLGQKTILPKFPVENWDEFTKKGEKAISENQNLENWIKTFEKTIKKQIKKDEKICIVAHSLGPLFCLHLVERFNLKIDCAIFVSPFLNLKRGKKLWQIDNVNKTFYKHKFNFRKLKKSIQLSYVLYSDNDPYVPIKKSIEFGKKLDSSIIFVKKAGHMNSEVNLNEFPLVLELCKTQLDLCLYQRYLENRYSFVSGFVLAKKEKEFEYPVEEINQEGTYHFRHLQKSGFCTFLYEKNNYWEPMSKYMVESRRCAKRMKNITRVFIIKQINDINDKKLQKQIKLDLKAGIKLFYILKKDLLKTIKYEDFGIWDEQYICKVPFSKKGKPMKVIMSSKKKDLKEFEKYRKEILKKSTRIKSMVF
jgi:uncharacterized protein